MSFERVKVYSKGKLRRTLLVCTVCHKDADFLDWKEAAVFFTRKEIQVESCKWDPYMERVVTEITGNVICECWHPHEEVVKLSYMNKSVSFNLEPYGNLTHLSLERCKMGKRIDLPPSLKHLSLSYIGFLTIHGSFELETLSEHHCCELEYSDSVNQLGKLKMFYSVEHTSAEHIKYMPELEKLVLGYGNPVECSIPPKLKHLDLRWIGFQNWESVIDYVRQSPFLRTLKLTWENKETIEKVLEACSESKMVKNLKLELGNIFLDDYSIADRLEKLECTVSFPWLLDRLIKNNNVIHELVVHGSKLGIEYKEVQDFLKRRGPGLKSLFASDITIRRNTSLLKRAMLQRNLTILMLLGQSAEVIKEIKKHVC